MARGAPDARCRVLFRAITAMAACPGHLARWRLEAAERRNAHPIRRRPVRED
jgi:hypothetical protein